MIRSRWSPGAELSKIARESDQLRDGTAAEMQDRSYDDVMSLGGLPRGTVVPRASMSHSMVIHAVLPIPI